MRKDFTLGISNEPGLSKGKRRKRKGAPGNKHIAAKAQGRSCVLGHRK